MRLKCRDAHDQLQRENIELRQELHRTIHLRRENAERSELPRENRRVLTVAETELLVADYDVRTAAVLAASSVELEPLSDEELAEMDASAAAFMEEFINQL